jgi:hypothetical protein
MQAVQMFAPLAISKAIPQSTNTWDSARFANFEPDTDDDDFEEEEEEYEEELYSVGGGMHLPQSSIFAATPEYTEDYGYDFDPRIRGVTSSVTGGAEQVPVPVLNTIVNPVENLSNRIPLPTVLSPVDLADVAGVGRPGTPPQEGGQRGEGMDPMKEDATCCGPYIPHFELRQTRENLGLNQAQRARFGTSPGEGVSLQEDEIRVSGTQQTQHGPVPISDPLYTHELYDQGFISMSAVPSVFAGVFTDPITGEEYDAYESAMPPPDADYEEALNSPGRNVKLAHLQGGWRDTTPRPTKTEILDDDFHMTYDRSINTYGTYDPSYYLEVIEHNNRFNHDDHHPDSDGPVVVGLPANTLGNQGDVKIRPMPYLKPTNRGKWAETTFRSGIDPQVAVAGGEQRLEYEWTNTPYVRAENSRVDGGGMEATANYQGFTQQYGGAEGFDKIDTQRSVSQHHMPNMGPAMVDVPTQQVYGEVAAPNSITGTIESGNYAVGPMTAYQDAQMLQNQLVAPPTSLTGLDAIDEAQFGPSQYEHDGQKLMNARIDDATKKTGLATNTQLSMGTQGTYQGQQLNKLVHSAQYKTKREALERIQSVFNTALGGYTAQPNQATRTRFSDKSGHLTDFVMPSSAIGGTESMVTNGTQNLGAVTNLSSKREAMYDNQFGVKTTTPDDSTVYLGEYRQNMEHLNVRPEGNLTHLAGTSGMAIGLRDDREALSR